MWITLQGVSYISLFYLLSRSYTVYTTSVVSLCLRWVICLRTAVYRKYKGERKTVCVYERENEWKGKNTFHGLAVASATVKLANYQTEGTNHYLLRSGRLRNLFSGCFSWVKTATQPEYSTQSPREPKIYPKCLLCSLYPCISVPHPSKAPCRCSKEWVYYIAQKCLFDSRKAFSYYV